MANEGSLWDWLKKARDHFGKTLHIRRVENAVSVGDPDTDGMLLGQAFTLELKCCAMPARGSTTLRYHEVTDAQVDWHTDRLAAGGASAFLVQVGDGHEAERYVVHGREAHKLRTGVTLDWIRSKGMPVRKAVDAIDLATTCTELA